jgi:TRAP-type transport system periplasmic protein
MKKLLVSLLMIGLICVLLFGGCSQPAPTSSPATSAPPASTSAPKPPASTSAPAATSSAAAGQVIKLKAVSFQAPNASSTATFMIYIDAVNAKGKGKVQIDYLGGPEVATRDAAPQSARTGVIDIVYEPFTFYGGVVPIGNAMQFSNLTAQQEINNGLWDFVRELHAKAGLFWLGRANSVQTSDNYWNSVKPVTKIADLAGMRAGSGSTTSKSLVEKVGGSFVQVAVGDVFTGLQTGVIDAYITPPNGQVAASAHKVCKFIINHPFYKANQSLFMGLDKWNKLPKDVQDILVNTLIEKQDAMNIDFAASNKTDLQKMLDAGEKLVTLPGDEGPAFVKMAEDAAKADVIKNYPEAGPKILELSAKVK